MVSVQLQNLLFVSDVFQIPSNNMRAHVFVYCVYPLWYTLIFVSDEGILGAPIEKKKRLTSNVMAPSIAFNISLSIGCFLGPIKRWRFRIET